MHFEPCGLNILKSLLGNNFKITQLHSCTKAWKIESKSRPPEYISAFQHHLVPVALIPKVPLHMFVLKSLFIGGSMCCNIQISRKWTVKAKSITSKTQPVMAPALHVCPSSNLKCSLFQMVPYDCPDFQPTYPALVLVYGYKEFFFPYLQVSKKNEHFLHVFVARMPQQWQEAWLLFYWQCQLAPASALYKSRVLFSSSGSRLVPLKHTQSVNSDDVVLLVGVSWRKRLSRQCIWLQPPCPLLMTKKIDFLND